MRSIDLDLLMKKILILNRINEYRFIYETTEMLKNLGNLINDKIQSLTVHQNNITEQTIK